MLKLLKSFLCLFLKIYELSVLLNKMKQYFVIYIFFLFFRMCINCVPIPLTLFLFKCIITECTSYTMSNVVWENKMNFLNHTKCWYLGCFKWGFTSYSRIFHSYEMKTSLLSVKGCKFWPIIDTCDIREMKVL